MKWATILRWNGLVVETCRANADVCTDSPATNEGVRFARLRLHAGAVGTMVTVVFQNPDEARERTATVVAVDAKEPLRNAPKPPFRICGLTRTSTGACRRRHRLREDSRGDAFLSQLLPDRMVARSLSSYGPAREGNRH
jgi:hypothetical protein